MDHGNPLEGEVCVPELPSFQIRRFVSSVRSINLFKCWPFRQKILEKSLNLGLKPVLPPFDLTPKGEDRLQNKHQESGQDIPCEADAVVPKGEERLQNEHQEGSQDIPCEAENVQCCSQDKGGDECTNGSDAIEQEVQDEVAEIFSTTPDSTTSGVAHALPPILVSERSSDISNDNVGTCTINMASDLLDSVRIQLDDKNMGPTTTIDPEVDHGNDLTTEWHQEGVHDSLVDPMKEIENIIELGEVSQAIPESSAEKCYTLKQTNDVLVENECNGQQNNLEAEKNCEDFSFTDPNLDALIQQVCPVCLSFTSTSNTTLNAHIDHCLESVLPSGECEARAGKSRMKPRKMRSMVEICAEAPSRTLEDLELCSEQWDLDGKNSNDHCSSHDMQSNGHASVRRCNIVRIRQPGKSRSSHNRSNSKQKEAFGVDRPSIDLRLQQQRSVNIAKRLKSRLQGNMRSRHTFDTKSEEQRHEKKHLHFAGSTSLESFPKNSKKQSTNEIGLQERSVPGDDEDDNHEPDEEDDLQWLRRLDTTILDTSAYEERRLQQKLKLDTRALDFDTSSPEEIVYNEGESHQRHSGSTKASPTWIIANEKRQRIVSSSDNNQLVEKLKKRKLQERHVEGMQDNEICMIVEDVVVDLQAGTSQRNKSIHKRKIAATVGASASHDKGRTTATQFSSLKRKSSDIQKEGKGIIQAKNKRKSLQSCDSFSLSEHTNAHETMSITLNAVDERGIISTSPAFSVDENMIAMGDNNDYAVEKQQISSQCNTYQQLGKKPSRDGQKTVHVNQEKQIPDSEGLRREQRRASNCVSVPESLRNRSLNTLSDESCSSLVESVKETCKTGHLWSQGAIAIAPVAAIETHASFDNRRFFYTNEVMPCSQSDDLSMTRGYASNLGGSNPAVGVTNQNVLLSLKNHQPDMMPSRVSMNMCSQRLETPGTPILEARSSERLSGNAFPEQLTSNYDVYNGENVRSCPYSVPWPNTNQHLYQKDIGILQSKCNTGHGEVQKQSHNLLIKDGIGKGFQDSVDTGICNGIGHDPQSNLTPRILASNTISTSQPTVRFEDGQVMNQHEMDGCASIAAMQTGRMTDLLDGLTRSIDGKSMRVQGSMPTRYHLQPTPPESLSQHMHRDLLAAFPSESVSRCPKTNGHAVRSQYLRSVSQAEKGSHPALITEYVNSTEKIEAYKGRCPSSTPHMPRSVTLAGMNGRTSLSAESIKSYNTVDYSGEQGVVHIFGNPVFKLMGRNVMVANNNIKPLTIDNSIDQNGGHRFYPSNSLSCLQEPHGQRYNPPEMFSPCLNGDSSRLGNHSFMLENTTIHAGDLQRAASSKFSQLSPSIYNNNVISTCQIQVEKGQSLRPVPEIQFKQHPTLVNNTRKQAVESGLIEDCICKDGNNCLLKFPNTMSIHNESQPKAHSQAFHSSLSSHMVMGSAVNGYLQHSGTLADIVQSSERNSHRSVGCSFAGRKI